MGHSRQKPAGRTPRSQGSRGTRESLELLLEIGTEELPHQFIQPALTSLGHGAERLLKDHRLAHGALRTMGTPRRLVLIVEGLSARQTPFLKEALGPPKAAAFDAAGQPTKAALGFATGQGVAVQDLEIRQTPKGEYVCAVKREPGLATATVLTEVCPALIQSLSFPKTMRWNATGVRFARPIRWLLALCGGQVVPFKIGGIASGARTWGHRFLAGAGGRAGRPHVVKSVREYRDALARAGVVPEPDQRRAIIVAQLKDLAASVTGQPEHDEDLLEQSVFTVECPQTILGSFDRAYLAVPAEVLKTAMKEHQGYFPVVDQQGSLLPRFLSVSNMKLRNMELIRKGNERVLAARLADAKFFYEEDRRASLADRVDKLKGVIFHQKLGSLHQKTGRIMALGAKIADALGDLDLMETVRRAGQLSKADLLTGMVGEFPSLQGVMGGEYARLDGEPAEVCAAIREHYLPRAMEGDLPGTPAGRVLSLADRLDTIVAFFHVGVIPTGSEDPLGLRRHASAVVRILIEGPLRLDLRELVAQARANVEAQGFQRPAPAAPGKSRPIEIEEFLLDRLRYYGRTVHALREDLMEAVIKGAAERSLDIVDLLARMRALQGITRRPEFDPLIIGFKRAHRLTQKEQWDRGAVDAHRFQHPSEETLLRHLQDAAARVPACLSEGRYEEGLDLLVGLKPAIDAFFEAVMVNAEDPALRANRLSLLQSVADLFITFADFSAVMVESK